MRPDVKKLVLSLLPYVFIAWLFGKAAECYRLSAGADMVTKLMGTVSGLGDLLSANPLPSFHPRDLLFGLCAAAAIRAAVYLKGKNAKKYQGARHGLCGGGTDLMRVLPAAPAGAPGSQTARALSPPGGQPVSLRCGVLSARPGH